MLAADFESCCLIASKSDTITLVVCEEIMSFSSPCSITFGQSSILYLYLLYPVTMIIGLGVWESHHNGIVKAEPCG